MAQAARAATSPVVRFVSADGVAYEPPAQLLYHAADPPNRVQSPLRWHSGPRASASPHVSPGLKRHRSPVLQRDSLKSRYSPGRPGSRRHQRWSNDQALAQDFTDEDLRELYAMDWRSALSELFDGNDKMQQWQDFCEASEEHQRAILMRFNKTSSPSAKTRRALQPQERYDRIDRRVKALLKRGVGMDFLAAFEQRLYQLVYPPEHTSGASSQDSAVDVDMVGGRGAERGSRLLEIPVQKTRGGASVVLNDSMHRLLAHAVCLYHAVQVSAISRVSCRASYTAHEHACVGLSFRPLRPLSFRHRERYNAGADGGQPPASSGSAQYLQSGDPKQW